MSLILVVDVVYGIIHCFPVMLISFVIFGGGNGGKQYECIGDMYRPLLLYYPLICL